jgi:hypothetical protein
MVRDASFLNDISTTDLVSAGRQALARWLKSSET